ncbi:tyrosine-type recombinase/integrase [Escherichia coli]|uniref:tyrosine-type recombinase/integrase n=1 Tax=Enterobacteriaceae TaxID=543 RepID=UPI000F86B943|nr:MULTISPECIES: tyrosine-type recombinase/integrase [Enterobacteriaceae]EGJ4966466.1 tyrosine-type recombinase/integrase [Escherichia coli]EGJ4985193.1 tyrosine-type recombinase/integrase [Escherichia coli]EGJ4998981.1 tyrosine-type recombinase/integrase [Escherichia coli]EGJ6387312.1 tyrosine-type recombinase/integrase [Escherichia coli]EGJ6415329.1 tyrosine-type recombinase/integrase [Escherichia coli]
MNFVEGCKSVQEVKAVAVELLKQGKGLTLYRDAWLLGYELMLRVSDLRSIRYADIKGDHLVLSQQKTGESVRVRLTDTAKRIIAARREANLDHVYLLQLDSHRSKGKPVSRSKLHEEISYAGEKLGLNLSTHSMRKSKPTIGYDNGEDIAVISKALGHKSLSSTLHYIGATQRKVDDFSDKYSIEDLL